MFETQQIGAPFVYATGPGPRATAIDDDIYLTVTAAVPDSPGRAQSIAIILSIDIARAMIAELSTALTAAEREAAV